MFWASGKLWEHLREIIVFYRTSQKHGYKKPENRADKDHLADRKQRIIDQAASFPYEQ